MSTQLAQHFRAQLEEFLSTLQALPSDLMDAPLRPGGWNRKQVLGHMLDSATNNRQRFVRASIDGEYAGPSYTQQAWVAAHGYAAQTWETLLRWWQAEHEILASVVDHIPADRLESSCVVGADAPVTLRSLIEDYLRHQQGHLAQLSSTAEKL